MSDVTHWAWNGLQYYPSNVPRVQRGLGNIVFPEGENLIKMKMLPGVPNQVRNIKVNPDVDPPKKQGNWTIIYLNSEPILVPSIDAVKNPDTGRIEYFPKGELIYNTKLTVSISTQDKTKYYIYNPYTHGGIKITPKNFLIWWDVSGWLQFTDPSGNKIITTFTGDPEIDNYLPVYHYCVNKISLPPNLDN